jgi:hypothetical protein
MKNILVTNLLCVYLGLGLSPKHVVTNLQPIKTEDPVSQNEMVATGSLDYSLDIQDMPYSERNSTLQLSCRSNVICKIISSTFDNTSLLKLGNVYNINFGLNEEKGECRLELSNSESNVIVSVYGLKTSEGVFLSQVSLSQCQENYQGYLLKEKKISEKDYDRYNSLRNQNSVSESHEMPVNAAITLSASNTTTVSGWMNWKTDKKTFPLRYNYVELVQQQIAGQAVLKSTYTDYNGYYSFSLSDTDVSTMNILDTFVRVYAKGQYTGVVKSHILQTKYYYDTDPIKEASPLMLSGNGTAIGGHYYRSATFFMDDSSNIGRAMQISQALNYGEKYAYAMDGSHPGYVNAQYPQGDNHGGYENFWGLHLGTYTYKYWDLILHEYGHHLQKWLGITDNPGLDHTQYEDDIEKYGKDKGSRLAWGESWPTVYAILATQYYSGDLNGLEYINDCFYQAPDKNDVMWNDDLENAYKVTGEGNEENIMQVLYDLYDDGTNESFDKISIGHKNLWNLVKGSKAKTFSQFANYCYSSTLFTNDEFGKLLENYGMASSYFYATSTTDPNTPPTFRWKSSNNNSSNRYELEFLDANKNTAIKKESLTDLSYTLTKDEWKTICLSYGSSFYVRVISYQDAKPATGGYCTSLKSYPKPQLNIEESLSFYDYNRLIEKTIELYPKTTAKYKIRFSRSGNKMIQTLGSIDVKMSIYDGNTLLKANDDSGYRLNSFMSVYLDSDHDYTIEIKGYSDEVAGLCRLIITQAFSFAEDGYSFDSFDHIDNIEGTNFDYYAYNQQYWVQAVRFTPTEMGDYTISLSSQYDNYLYVFDPRLGTSMYQNGEYDDDSGEGSNALLKKHLEKGIPYLVIFSQYNPSSTFTDFDKGDDCLVSFRKN